MSHNKLRVKSPKEKKMTNIKNLESQSIITFTLLVLLMCLTRGSHFLSPFALPDASFALFLIGGMLLKKPRWCISLFTFSAVIDLVTLSIDNTYQILINVGYIGLLASYGIMWVFGSRFATSKSFLNFIMFSVIATLIALDKVSRFLPSTDRRRQTRLGRPHHPHECRKARWPSADNGKCCDEK